MQTLSKILVILSLLGCSNNIETRKTIKFYRTISLYEGIDRSYFWPIYVKEHVTPPDNTKQAIDELNMLLDSGLLAILKRNSIIKECNSNLFDKGEVYDAYLSSVLNDMSKRYPIKEINRAFKTDDSSKIINRDILTYIDNLMYWVIDNWELKNNNTKLVKSLNSLGIKDPYEMFYYVLLLTGDCKYKQDKDTPELFIWDD